MHYQSVDLNRTFVLMTWCFNPSLMSIQSMPSTPIMIDCYIGGLANNQKSFMLFLIKQ